MLISHIAEGNGKHEACVEEIDVSESDDVSSAQRDLLILYENDAKQTSVMGKIYRMPNQYVENVVYKDDDESEDSDMSDFYRGEDFYDVVMINKERLDLLSGVPSAEKSLRQKFGDIAIQSGYPSNYHRHNLSRNPFITSQCGSLNDISNYNTFDGALLSTCLLDFICYNQMEDNSNFYMDSIIQYAKRTIDQLKRISNGDYLTEKAKEHWKILSTECKSQNDSQTSSAITAKSQTIYLKSDTTRTFQNTLRGLVHSEFDMRSLSKILQKQLFARIPRLIRGSYKIFGKFFDNDVVIEYKKVKQQGVEKKNKSRVDIFIKVTTSSDGKQEEGKRNISALDSKQTLPCLENKPLVPEECDILHECTTNIVETQNDLTITELNECDIEGSGDNLKNGVNYTTSPFKIESSDTANSSPLYISDISLVTDAASNGEEHSFNTNESTIGTTASCALSPDDLFCSIQQFNMQTALLEENEDIPAIKKKSPTKVRIKSPYENKTFAIEERKRRKLLEIRERREKRKKALSENCKVTKHRYGKGAIMAQASNSVTKLSITNKSFYTSIYGDTANIVNKHDKRRSVISDTCIDEPVKVELVLSKESKKFVNRSFYLDDPDTEVRNIRNKPFSFNNDNGFSALSSTYMVNDIKMKLNSFVQLDKTSSSSLVQGTSFDGKKYDSDPAPKYDPFRESMLANASTSKSLNHSNIKKEQISLECKKSIDKIYELMKRLNSADSESSCSKRDFSQFNDNEYQTATQSFTIRATDSGTSVKHRLKSSNPSIYSFEGQSNTEIPLAQSITTGRSDPEPNIIPKVIISSKSQTASNNKEIKPPKKVTIKAPPNISRNPLKAISHLINEFDIIQKSRQKPATDLYTKDHRKSHKPVVESKNITRQNFVKRGSTVDNTTKDVKPELKKTYPGADRKCHPKSPVKGGKNTNQTANLDRNIDRDRKISDLIDDALREARGEAVKGPKLNPRLESLAQPKRVLVNGQEELRLRHRKQIDRAPINPTRNSQILERNVVSPVTNIKIRQKRYEMEYSSPTKIPNYYPSTDKINRIKRPQYPQNNGPTSNATIHNLTRTSKKISPNDVNIKKRPLSLTQTAGSSNLFQKVQTSHVTPPDNLFLQSKESASPVPSPVKKIVDIESRCLNNSVQEKPSEPVQVIINSLKETENNSERKTDSVVYDNEIISTSSDYAFDVLEDKDVTTAVESVCKKKENCDEEQVEEIGSDISCISNLEKCNDITTEGIKNLEKALYRQLSQGVFLKRPKVKNLTLTPKQSSHKVFLLQCGDTNSLLIKSCVSQNLHMNNTKCMTNSGFELNFPLLSNSYIDRKFSRTSANITTVGYAFPETRSIKCNPINRDTPVQKPNIMIPDHKLLIKSNHEKGVQALLLDKDINNKILDSNIVKKTTKDKIDKGTEWDKSLICNVITSEASNHVGNENIDNTTSLDILTELMEEIEKITKYQSVSTKNEEKEINLPHCTLTKNCVCHNLVNDNIFNAPLVSVDNKTKFDNVATPRYVDKEVAVYITKESVNECTDAPSQLWFPKDRFEHTSSNLTVSQRSSHSLVSLYDYRALYSNKFKDISDISVTYSKSKLIDDSAEEYKFARKSVIGLDQENWALKNLIKRDRKDYNDFVDESDCNAVLKMKRDILVTVYSILVFTVFAALSFPEILYNM